MHWSRYNSGLPDSVAELGPGDSLGTGLAALLSGVNHVYSLDVIRFWDNERNLRIFDELLSFFQRKAVIPDNSVYPRVKPQLENYDFPEHLLTEDILKKALDPKRVEAIREEIMNIDNPGNKYIRIKIPWHDADVIDPGTIDLIYSQAVLECIDELDETYMAMCSWLKPGGMMSHTIDFKSHGLTKQWNGHWKFRPLEWQLVKGGREFVLNRQPLSVHMFMHKRHGFEVLEMKPVRGTNSIPLEELSEEFRNLSEEDKTTESVYILAKRGSTCF